MIGLTLLLLGCTNTREFYFDSPDTDLHYKTVATAVQAPTVTPARSAQEMPIGPYTLSSDEPKDYWDLPLEEAIRVALTQSTVLRDLGGRVLTAPQTAASTFDPALRESDPRTGPEAALSQFDAEFTSRTFWTKSDRVFNNIFEGFGEHGYQKDSGHTSFEIKKRAATGTQISVSNTNVYSQSDSAFNLFPSAWDATFEAQVRHPLLQGGGIEYNRIAGPQALPGVYNGVVLGRINTDVAIADFETGVRNLVGDIEEAYWDLYFAYRDVDARLAGRDSSLQLWRSVHRKFEVGASGGDRETEARAREQYYLFVGQAENSLAGVAGPAGLSVGGGVYATERRLRLLLGLSPSDGRLIRPADEPATAQVQFDWSESFNEALVRRSELRRQRWVIKRRELELVASHNFMLPSLDVLGTYRFRGFGQDLFGDGPAKFDSAYQNLFDGDQQEWQLGAQLSVPLGRRLGFTAVRNAELQLARERAVLAEQELQVAHQLSGAMAELDRAYHATRTTYNRRTASREQAAAVARKYEAGIVTLDFVLEAQRRLADAESTFYRALVDYNEAIAQVHFQRGSLLDYNGVYLNEGPWPGKAYDDAEVQTARYRERKINYVFARPCPIACGEVPQGTFPGGYGEEIVAPPLPDESPAKVEVKTARPALETVPKPDDGAAGSRRQPTSTSPPLRTVPALDPPEPAKLGPFFAPPR